MYERGDAMLNITDLKKCYGEKTVLSHINLEMSDPSKVYMLTGGSGSGKTTLFNIIFGLDQDYSGSYKLFGKEAS